MKTLTFDLGDTLIEYEGLPLSWEEHYPAALKRLSLYCQHNAAESAVAKACDVLRRYNTRLHPRINEVRFEQIMDELIEALGCSPPQVGQFAAQAFFSVFRQRLNCFPDTPPCLQKAKAAGMKVGVFTDVPYGMPKNLVVEDARCRTQRSNLHFSYLGRCWLSKTRLPFSELFDRTPGGNAQFGCLRGERTKGR